MRSDGHEMPLGKTLLRHLLTLGLAVLIALPAVTQVGCSGAQTDAAEAATSDSDEDADSKRKGRDGDEAEDDEPDPVPVEVTTLDTGPIEEVLRYSTNLEAEDDVAVFAEASRKVIRLLVEEGDWVRKGQTLVRLQDDEQRTRLAKAQVQYDKAAREYERQTRLHAQELIAEQAFNDATYEVERLELELEEARRELSYTEVRAPISGTVTERLVNLGDFVTSNQKLFHIVDFNSLVARVFVPEKELRRLAVEQEARIHAPALGEDSVRRLDRPAGAGGRSAERHSQGDRRRAHRGRSAPRHVRPTWSW